MDSAIERAMESALESAVESTMDEVSKRCMNPGCMRQRMYASPGDATLRCCLQHREDGMENCVSKR